MRGLKGVDGDAAKVATIHELPGRHKRSNLGRGVEGKGLCKVVRG
jgi:hypothetical protein